jgi:hypothetical protein
VRTLPISDLYNRGSMTKKRFENTYGSQDSLVVTHPTTNQPACSLSMTEQTGSPVFYTLWPYVEEQNCKDIFYVEIREQLRPTHPRGFAVHSALKDAQSRAWKRIWELHRMGRRHDSECIWCRTLSCASAAGGFTPQRQPLRTTQHLK